MNSFEGPFFKGSTLTYRTRDSFERGCLFFFYARLQKSRRGGVYVSDPFRDPPCLGDGMEYIPVSETGFCGFDSRPGYH